MYKTIFSALFLVTLFACSQKQEEEEVDYTQIVKQEGEEQEGMVAGELTPEPLMR